MKVIRTKRKKKNNIVVLIKAGDSRELAAIKKEFLDLARKISRKRELGFYIAPAETASLETIQDFCNLRLEICAFDG